MYSRLSALEQGIASILGKNGSEFISQQYNAVTPGNEMKPDAILVLRLVNL